MARSCRGRASSLTIRTALTPTARVRPHNRRVHVPGQSRRQAELRQRRASLGHTVELCGGFEGLPCTFSTLVAGGRARVQPSRGQLRCVFCSAAAFRTAAASARPKITHMLRKLWALDTQITQAALDRIRTWEGEEAAAMYAAAARSPTRTNGRTS